MLVHHKQKVGIYAGWVFVKPSNIPFNIEWQKVHDIYTDFPSTFEINLIHTGV